MQIDSLVVAKLDQTIETVKTFAPEVWRIYMKQTAMEGMIGSIFGGFLFVAGVALCIIAYLRPRHELRGGYTDFSATVNIIGIISTIIGPIIVLCWITKIINPEYYALQMLLGR